MLYRWRWPAFDVALAITLTALSVVNSDGPEMESSWWGFTVPLVLGIVVRRRWPLAAVILTVVGAAGHHLASTAEPIDLAVPVALFTLANAAHPRRVAGVTFGCLLLGVTLMCLTGPYKRQALFDVRSENFRAVRVPPEQMSDMASLIEGCWRAVPLMLVLGFAYLLGDHLRARRVHLETLEQRAADLEREQRQRVDLATAAERARITRELHDVVAHGLSVMVMQAQGGAAALRRHPERTESALQNVIETGRSSLSEMRRLLAVVRRDTSGSPELAPQPGVDALPELIDRIRTAGTPVSFAVQGDPIALPATVDLSAYRIAQEALTNTLKHAGDGASAAVRLGFNPDRLEIEVEDDGVGGLTSGDGAGSGLRGLGERVAMFGGELIAGPGAASGFRVRAILPLRPTSALAPGPTSALPLRPMSAG
jgi:signal transduction histidine kinase